jgi:hypothetical protein
MDANVLAQALAGFVGGYVAAPVFQVSNKSSLPGITPLEVLQRTREVPFKGALWAATRQVFSSVRGTTSIMVMKTEYDRKGDVNMADLMKAVVLAAGAETFLAGVPFEIPETRVQSGFSVFSWHSIKVLPFMYLRNVVTCIAPAYFIRQGMLKENSGGFKSANKGETQRGVKSWGGTLLQTGAMSFAIASLGSPIQGIVARILQEESVSSATRGAFRDFDFKDPRKRSLTLMRVGSRAAANGITAIAMTTAYLYCRDYL